MINNNDIKKAMNDYTNSEFSIKIFKQKRRSDLNVNS